MKDLSVVEFVDKLLVQAIERGASDIHLEPVESGLRVRFRLDGVLYDQDDFQHHILADQVVSRIKILANINSAEKRIPQDGKFLVSSGSVHRIHAPDSHIDLRVSTFPSVRGEKVVIRILDRQRNQISLERLGMSESILVQFKELLGRPSGFFLVTGPTGSGKTTTLYSALNWLHAPEKNIVTLEDPVEYHLFGVTQGQIRPEAGFTFEKGMRALLRQDPDILMVGEIRDVQTAQIGVEAALTGHLVLSTLHTNDAPSTVMRLIDMGAEPFLINATVTGVLAQRLARSLCGCCRYEAAPTEQERLVLEKWDVVLTSVFNASGCDACLHVGHKGRVGIFELMPLTHELRARIVSKPDMQKLTETALRAGMKTLLHDGIAKVCQGVLSVSELARIIG